MKLKIIYIFLVIFGIVSCSSVPKKRTCNRDLERNNLFLGLSISEVEDRLNSNVELIKKSNEGDKYIFNIPNSIYCNYSDLPRCICLVDGKVIAYTIFYKEYSNEGSLVLVNSILTHCNQKKIESLNNFKNKKWSDNGVFYDISITKSLNQKIVFHCATKEL